MPRAPSSAARMARTESGPRAGPLHRHGRASGFQKVQADDVLILLGRTVDFPATLQVGAVTEDGQRHGRERRQIDLTSVTIQHNVTAEEFDRMPKARSFQDRRAGRALGEPGRDRGRLPGERRQRRRERVHRRRRRHQQPGERRIASEHGVRVPAGSAGQDHRHLTRSTAARSAASSAPSPSPAATRSAARAHYYYIGSGLARRPGEAPGARPGNEHDRRPTSRTTSSRTSRTSSAAPLAGRSSATGCSSSDRISPRLVRPHQRLRVLERHRAGSDQARLRPYTQALRQSSVFDQQGPRVRHRAVSRRPRRPVYLPAYDSIGPNSGLELWSRA